MTPTKELDRVCGIVDRQGDLPYVAGTHAGGILRSKWKCYGRESAWLNHAPQPSAVR